MMEWLKVRIKDLKKREAVEVIAQVGAISPASSRWQYDLVWVTIPVSFENKRVSCLSRLAQLCFPTVTIEEIVITLDFGVQPLNPLNPEAKRAVLCVRSPQPQRDAESLLLTYLLTDTLLQWIRQANMLMLSGYASLEGTSGMDFGEEEI